MKIYQLAHSPYCIPVTQALTALGGPFEVVNIPAADRTELLRLTGGLYYQVPVLVDGNVVVFETDEDPQAVPRYVDAKFGGGKLFPAALDGLQAILLPYIENEVEGVTFRLMDPDYVASIEDVGQRGMVIRHKERKFGRGCLAKWAAQKAELTAQAAGLLRPFDQMLAHSPTPWILGTESPVQVDFALSGILGNMTYKNYNPLPDELPHLAKWYASLIEFRW